MPTERIKTLEFPDFGENKLLLTSGSPACEAVEKRLVDSEKRSRLSTIDNVEVVYFLESGEIAKGVKVLVDRVLLKGTNEKDKKFHGEPNGLILDAGSWLNGFLVNQDRGNLILIRNLMRNEGIADLESLYPGIYSDYWDTAEFDKKIALENMHWRNARRALRGGHIKFDF